MTTRRYFANNAPQQTLNASITSGATSCVINGSFSGWPTQFPYFAELDYGTASAEIVSVTNVSGTTATIVRGQGGTAAISHAAGATIDHVFVAQDMDEANAHTSANAGVHGISGSVVGTSDVQTLTNKTLASPTLTGTATGAAATFSGTVQQATSTTTGNATVAGTMTVTGAHQAGSYTANSNGTVTGVLVPRTYTNEAAAVAALGSPAVGSQVWLSAPTFVTGAPAGLFTWNGTTWVPVTPAGVLSDTVSATSVTLSTTAAFAGSASVTLTLGQARRIRVDCSATYVMNTAGTGRYFIHAAYNTGASVVIGSNVTMGQTVSAVTTTTGAAGAPAADAAGTALLAAGQYTFYPVVQRNSGGGATDTATSFGLVVTDCGSI